MIINAACVIINTEMMDLQSDIIFREIVDTCEERLISVRRFSSCKESENVI